MKNIKKIEDKYRIFRTYRVEGIVPTYEYLVDDVVEAVERLLEKQDEIIKTLNLLSEAKK